MAAPSPFRVLLGREDVSQYVNENLSFSAVDPGGFETCAFTFPRKVSARRGLPIRIEAGLATAWEGRVGEAGNKLAGTTGKTVTGEGYGAALKDNDMAIVYIDRDLSHWQPMAAARQINWIAIGYNPSATPSISTDDQSPALTSTTDGVLNNPVWETIYDAGDLCRIAYLDAQSAPVNLASTDTLFSAVVYGSDDVAVAAYETSPQLRATPHWQYVPGRPRRYITLAGIYVSGAAGSEGVAYGMRWRDVFVVGDHGLTGRLSTGAGNGYWPSDIVGHVLTQLPGIEAGVIETSAGLVIGQSEYRTPVPHEQIVADMGKLAGWHWGTWEHQSILGGRPRFDFRSYPGGPTCHVSRADLDDLDLVERVGDLYNKARVTWQDTAGTSHLELRTRDVPELAEAIPGGRTLPLDMGVSTQDGAQAYGDLLLALSARKARAAGSASTTGQVNTTSGPKPAYLVRPGLDCLRVTDLPDLPLLDTGRADFQISRVATTTSRETISTDLELGTGPDLAEVLAARRDANTAIALGGG